MKSGNSAATAAKPQKFSFVPELVPAPLWGRSGYRMMGKRKAWKIIRQDTLAKAGHQCAGCGSTQGQLSCHEKWEYDDKKATATLAKFESHCPLCDLVSHAGRAMAHGFERELIGHLCKMNKCSEGEAYGIIESAMEQWGNRSEKKWTIIVQPAILKLYPQLAALPDFVPRDEND